MTKIRFLSAATLASVVWLSPARAAEPLEPARVEAFVDGAVRQAMTEHHIAGVTVAVIDRNGPLLLKGYGIAGHGRRVDADTLFRVGSISKTITWIALMQLVEQGKLSLDDPVNAHLPKALRIPDEGFTTPIRIRHLMTHSAGFEDSALGVNVTQDLSRVRTLAGYLERYRVHRVRPPGQLTVYSNYGAALAGAIVEHETHMDFPTYAETRILRPLGAATATFREPYPVSFRRAGFPASMPSDVLAHASSGFRYREGRFVEQSWEYLPHLAPAGAMSASARDMAAYMRALLMPELFGAAKVLRVETVLSMREPSFRNDPRLSANRHGFWEIPTPSGEFAFGHNGGMAFQQSFMGILPRSGIAIFVAVNTTSVNSSSPMVATLPFQIMQEFLGARPVKRVAAPDTASFAGCYRPLRRAYFRTERALFDFANSACLEKTPYGDLLFGNEAYLPVGRATYERGDGGDRIAFGMRDGRMMLFDFGSNGPRERIGFFQTPNWLFLIGGLAGFVVLGRVLSGIVRLLKRSETRADAVLDGLSLLWLGALTMFAVAAGPWLSDFAEPLLNYPGTLLPIACWLFLGAALATAAAIAVLLLVARPKAWPWFVWTGAGFTLATYAAFAITLGMFGFLGFSGW